MENFDEVPINQTNKLELNEYSNEQKEDYSHIPLPQRITDKNWKIRLSAYDELQNFYSSHPKDDSPNYTEIKQLHKCLIETNPSCFDKAVSMLRVYVKAGGFLDAELTVKNAIEKGKLIQKGVAQMKTQVIRIQVFDLICDAFDKQKDNEELRLKFHEQLINQINSKVPKNSIASIQLLTYIIQNFGINYVDLLKPYLKVLKKMAESTNGDQRKEALLTYIEAYKYIQDGLLPFISDLKKQQQDELNKEFEAYNQSGLEAQPLRLPKVEKKNVKKLEAFDLAEAIDIFKQFDDSWCEKTTQIEKWQDRMQNVKDLTDAASTPKILETSNYLPAVLMFKKILLLDGNINVQKQCIKATTNIIQSLRKPFEKGAKILFPLLVDKLKDKKTIDDVQTCLMKYPLCIQITSLQEQINQNLADKNPTLKIQLMIWIEKIISEKLENAEKLEFIKIQLQKLSGDPDKGVRSQATKLIGLFNSEIKVVESTDSKVNPKKKENKSPLKSANQDPKNFMSVPVEKKTTSDFMTIEEAIQGVTDNRLPEKFIQFVQEEKNLLKSVDYLKDDSIIPKICKCVDHFCFIVKEKYKKLLSNLSVNKELLKIIQSVAKEQIISNNAFASLQPLMMQNINDPKFVQPLQTLISSQFDLSLIHSTHILPTLIQSIMDPNSKCGPKSYENLFNILVELLNKYADMKMPWSGIQGICKIWFANKNAGIRNMAIELMKICWEKKGDESLKQLKNLDEAWKTIKGNIQESKRPGTSKGDSGKKGFKNETKVVDNSKISQFNVLSQSMAIYPEEIKQPVKKIDNNIMIQKLQDKQVAIRQEGFQMLEQVVKNQSLQTNNMTTLQNIVIQRITDSNKPFQKVFIQFIPCFIQNYQKHLKTINKPLIDSLLSTITDKQLKPTLFECLSSLLIMLPVADVLNPMISYINSQASIILPFLLENKIHLSKLSKQPIFDQCLQPLLDKDVVVRELGSKWIQEIVKIWGKEGILQIAKVKGKNYQQALDQINFDIQAEQISKPTIQISEGQTQSFNSSSLNLSQEIYQINQEIIEIKLQRIKQSQRQSIQDQFVEAGLLYDDNFDDFIKNSLQFINKSPNQITKYSDLIIRQIYIHSKNQTQDQFKKIFSILLKTLQIIQLDKHFLQEQEATWIFETLSIYIEKNGTPIQDIEEIFCLFEQLYEIKKFEDSIQKLLIKSEYSFLIILPIVNQNFNNLFLQNLQRLVLYLKQSNRTIQFQKLVQLGTQILQKIINQIISKELPQIMDQLNLISDIGHICRQMIYPLSNDVCQIIIQIYQSLPEECNKFNISMFKKYLIELLHKFITLQYFSKLNLKSIRLLTQTMGKSCNPRIVEMGSISEWINLLNSGLQDFNALVFDRIIAEGIKDQQILNSFLNLLNVKDPIYNQVRFVFSQIAPYSFQKQQEWDNSIYEPKIINNDEIQKIIDQLSNNINFEDNMKIILQIKKDMSIDFEPFIQQKSDLFKCYFTSYLFHLENNLIKPTIKKPDILPQNCKLAKIYQVYNERQEYLNQKENLQNNNQQINEEKLKDSQNIYKSPLKDQLSKKIHSQLTNLTKSKSPITPKKQENYDFSFGFKNPSPKNFEIKKQIQNNQVFNKDKLDNNFSNEQYSFQNNKDDSQKQDLIQTNFSFAQQTLEQSNNIQHIINNDSQKNIITDFQEIQEKQQKNKQFQKVSQENNLKDQQYSYLGLKQTSNQKQKSNFSNNQCEIKIPLNEFQKEQLIEIPFIQDNPLINNQNQTDSQNNQAHNLQIQIESIKNYINDDKQFLNLEPLKIEEKQLEDKIKQQLKSQEQIASQNNQNSPIRYKNDFFDIVNERDKQFQNQINEQVLLNENYKMDSAQILKRTSNIIESSEYKLDLDPLEINNNALNFNSQKISLTDSQYFNQQIQEQYPAKNINDEKNQNLINKENHEQLNNNIQQSYFKIAEYQQFIENKDLILSNDDIIRVDSSQIMNDNQFISKSNDIIINEFEQDFMIQKEQNRRSMDLIKSKFQLYENQK